MLRRLAVVACGAVLAGGCSGPSSVASRSTSSAPRTTTTVIPTTVPPTTTTVPLTTTTIATATVPDAASVGQSTGSSVLAEQVLTRAGFAYATVPTTSDACYFTSPLTGQQAWNAGEVIGQNPNPGTVAPVGSTVYLQICSGTVSVP